MAFHPGLELLFCALGCLFTRSNALEMRVDYFSSRESGGAFGLEGGGNFEVRFILIK